jgi:NAD(P)-dependent dehydrogenase (short-subunit alcohol dehydrogenase family)
MSTRFSGQVAIVTGAGGGIGRAHALLLGGEGASVVVNDYGGDSSGNRGTSAAAQAVVDEIVAAGGTAVADSHDVSIEGPEIVQAALDTFGGIHVIVNNAGIANGGQIDEIPPADFDRMLAIHLGGTVAVCRAAWPIMRAQGFGRIVNTSSASVFGLSGTSAYITAKAALFGLSRALGNDGRKFDIKVNAIMPSAYSRLTAKSPEFAPVMEAGFPPERIAPFVAALLTRECPCTGETFVVGGGRAARVVLATVPGITDITDIDDVLNRFDQIMDTGDLYIPPEATAQVLYECQQIGLDLAALMSAGITQDA